MARDILNYLGDKIGELDLTEGTTEEAWAEELAKYSAPPPSPDFKEITPRQVRLILLSMGVTNQMVIAAIEATIPSPERELALIEWEYSIGFNRHAPFVSGVGEALGLTEEQIDALWIAAAQI